MKRLRIMALMNEALVPPDDLQGYSDEEILEWKTEFDVVVTLEGLGHEVRKVGVSDDLHVAHRVLRQWRPHITFNLLEEFHGVAIYEQHVTAYLELMRQPYTGCNPRGLMIAHDKVLSKQILQQHGIPTPPFAVYQRHRRVIPQPDLRYPLFVKSASEDASFGLSEDSVVRTPRQLRDRIEHCHEEIGTDALVEEYIEGREIYVGVIGNRRLQVLPIWELIMARLPKGQPNVATARAKWDYDYQRELGLKTEQARHISGSLAGRIQRSCKQVYRALQLSGYARMDLRISDEGRIYFLEANPNPNISYGEDFAESAHVAGMEYEPLLQRILNLGLHYKAPWRE